MHRFTPLICGLCAAVPAPDPTSAETLSDRFNNAVERNVEGAMAVLGIAAVPSETASTLFLNTGQSSSEDTYDFQSAQLGGGFRWSETFPLWLEGYIGWNRYDPLLVFSDGAEQRQVPLKWTSVAATGGIGYEFDLNDYLVLRPQFHLTLGRIQTDLSVGAQVIANRLGLDTDILVNGGVTTGGVGGSLTLAYDRRWDNDWQFDASLRYTQIHLEPIAGDKELAGEATAATATLWTRLRQPTGYQAFNRPVRVVYELSGSYLPGDQGDVLDTEWLAQFGLGGELDFEETWVPWITTTRLVMRYTRGEHLEGFSIGLAASF